jgi:hypothetical protein
MATISRNWNNHFLIIFVIGENLFEPITDIEEVLVQSNSGFKNGWLNLSVHSGLVSESSISDVALEVSLCLWGVLHN